ncbi:MAG: aminotransferase class V-fold PLP-dependent enzyme [Patescibacteria group bacterium]
MSEENTILKQFPLLVQKEAKGDFVYLDSAATTQKPQNVIDAETKWYESFNANVHRGAYDLSERATDFFEGVRGKTAQFLHATNPKSIVFTRGTTSSINAIVRSWAAHNLQEGDTLLLTEMEHHANVVPWHMLAEEKNIKVKYWPITDEGLLEDVSYDELFKGVKLLSLVHVSNVLGTVNPIQDIIGEAHKRGVVVVVDAAQSVGHMPVDVEELQVDFLAFSSHKMYGPTGLGVLYVHPDRFAELKPFEGGGDMIRKVTKEQIDYKPMPWLLEAGTMPLAQVFAFGETLDYLSGIGMKKILHHDTLLVDYLYDKLSEINEIAILGPKPEQRSGIVSFTIENMHAHDIATLLNEKGVAIRTGHHCAQPLHACLGVIASARASVGVYTTKEDIDYFIFALKQAIEYWRKNI